MFHEAVSSVKLGRKTGNKMLKGSGIIVGCTLSEADNKDFPNNIFLPKLFQYLQDCLIQKSKSKNTLKFQCEPCQQINVRAFGSHSSGCAESCWTC